MDRDKIYQSLYNAYILAYPTKSKKVCQEELTKKWYTIKSEVDFPAKADQLLLELNSIAMKKKGSLLTFWSKQKQSDAKRPEKSAEPQHFVTENEYLSNSMDNDSDKSSPSCSSQSGMRFATGQVQLQ